MSSLRSDLLDVYVGLDRSYFYSFSPYVLRTKLGLRVLFRSPSVCISKIVILVSTSIFPWYKILQLKYIQMFTYSNIVLCISVLLNFNTMPTNAIILVFYAAILFQIFLLFLVKQLLYSRVRAVCKQQCIQLYNFWYSNPCNVYFSVQSVIMFFTLKPILKKQMIGGSLLLIFDL
jgi:hypothetical protein